ESLTLLEFLPQNARFADIGPGGGLPSIPCLIVRDDLKATLIESKIKKAAFLNDVVVRLGLSNRVIVVNRQFEEATAQNFEIVTCRALDKFAVRLRRLVRWSAKRRLLLFGGPGLEAAISELHLPVFARRLMPLSQQRFLFVIDPK
ncbi:MAG TPA: RsmG family class I SAM-dependent methyltransferase, partial [Pyrinomonadaceae bacterium]|nr:RsmG family class I SAM-dependent methyltransferase [Pyrinomonadaceae bacterium]